MREHTGFTPLYKCRNSLDSFDFDWGSSLFISKWILSNGNGLSLEAR